MDTPLPRNRVVGSRADGDSDIVFSTHRNDRIPLMSVIVSIHHLDTVHQLAQALGVQNLPPNAFEVIIANATALPVDHARLREVVDTHCQGVYFEYASLGSDAGRARALNFCMRRARGPLLWFLADDFIPSPGCLRAHLAFHLEHRDPRDAAVGAGLFSPRLRNSFMRRSIEDSGSLFGHSFTEALAPLAPTFFYAANTSIKHELARAAGEFDERFAADAWDDYDYSLRLQRLGYRARLLPEATCMHQHRVTLTERLTQLRHSGAAAIVLETTRPGLARWLRSALRRNDRNRFLSNADARLDWRQMSDFDRLTRVQSLCDQAFAEGYRAAIAEHSAAAVRTLCPVDIEGCVRRVRETRATTPSALDPMQHADPARMQRALALQRNDDFIGAQHLYLEELRQHPCCADALHMLGVLYLQAGFPAQASELIRCSIELTSQVSAAMKGNLGLCLAELSWSSQATTPPKHPPAAVATRPTRTTTRRESSPLVSIVVPSYNHRAYLGAALSSVFAQTYRKLELIVIDDGSRDGSPELLRDLLRYCPYPNRLVVRANRGAHRTINEGIELAQGRYVNVLNSDDRFPADRIERFVDLVERTGADWACSKVRGFDDSLDNGLRSGMLAMLDDLQRHVCEHSTLGFSFLRGNIAISSGNLFMRRKFAIDVGLFRGFRYNHDWDFCLRALWQSEPAYLPAVGYEYRVHAQNTITESRAAAAEEADGIVRQYLSSALSAHAAPNPLAPCSHHWGDAFVADCLEYGLGRLFDTRFLLDLQRRFAATGTIHRSERATNAHAAPGFPSNLESSLRSAATSVATPVQ
tara:strand:+ start:258 stop:2693 length:2436 start_codon:yes stop_codon:yes gene_type:complete